MYVRLVCLVSCQEQGRRRVRKREEKWEFRWGHGVVFIETELMIGEALLSRFFQISRSFLLNLPLSPLLQYLGEPSKHLQNDAAVTVKFHFSVFQQKRKNFIQVINRHLYHHHLMMAKIINQCLIPSCCRVCFWMGRAMLRLFGSCDSQNVSMHT